MTNLTNSVAAASPVAPAAPAPAGVWLSDLPADHQAFLGIDFGLHLLLLLLLCLALKGLLRWIARDGSDDHLGKVFIALSLMLGFVGLAFVTPYPPALRYVIVVPVYLGCVFILRQVCQLSNRSALLITALIGLVAAAGGFGLQWGQDLVFRQDRTSVRRQVQKTLGLIDDLAGREAAPIVTKDLLKQAKSGLRLQQESLVAAVYILRNPDYIEKLTLQHTEDLRALDLITDGKPPTPEELAELGITPEDQDRAKKGMAVLQKMDDAATVTEDDVQAVADLIRSTRPPGAEVSAQDIALVIHEARKRARARGGALVALADAVGANGSTNAASGLVAAGSPTGAVEIAVVRTAPAGPVDPLDRLGYQERDLWRATRADLNVEAVLRHGDQVTVMIKRQFVKVGEIYEVEREGRRFPWRLVEASDFKSRWEPVLTNSPPPPARM